jgi:hypothetical protein
MHTRNVRILDERLPNKKTKKSATNDASIYPVDRNQRKQSEDMEKENIQNVNNKSKHSVVAAVLIKFP